MNKLEKARQAILDYPLEEHFETISVDSSDYMFSKENISEGLQYCIDVVHDKVANESDIPIGSSKSKGAPHLPKNTSIAGFDGYEFLLQFNFEELKPYDIFGLFPKTGILYLFFDSDNISAKAIYFDGDIGQLQLLENGGDKKGLSKITFEAGFTYGNWDERHEITEAMPKGLNETLTSIFGFPLLDPLRHNFDKEISGNILGKPTFLVDDDEYENPYYLDEYVLLYDYCYGDNYLHFWIAPEDLKKRDFSSIEVSISVGG